MKYSIALADSQFLITESLKMLIQHSTEYVYEGLAENLHELNLLLESKRIDLLITDFNLIDYKGFDELKKILTQYPEMHVLILTNNITKNELNELIKAGIKAVIYKTADSEEILMAINSALKSKKYYSEEILELLLENKNNHSDLHASIPPTPTEIEIIKLIASGLTTKEIAAKRNVSFHTVISHRKNIFAKLNINNVSELVVYAVRSGIINDIEYYI